MIAAACTPSKKEEQAFFPTFSMGQLLLKNARYFPGMTLTVSPNPLEQIRSTAETLVKEFPSLKKLNKEMEAEEAALQKRLDGIRKEAEKVKGGEDRVEEIIAGKMRDFGISESAGARRAIRRNSAQFGAIRLAHFSRAPLTRGSDPQAASRSPSTASSTRAPTSRSTPRG